MHFSLNAETAMEAKASERTGGGIKAPGLYPGKINQAYVIRSDRTGSTGICLSFTAKTGQRADRLEIWTHDGDGNAFSGARTVYALMVVLKLRDMKDRPGKIEVYNSGSGGMVQADADVYPELAGKAVGLGINMEEYEKTGGGVGAKPILAFPYDLETDRVASEILDKKPKGEKLASMAESLWTKPVKGRQQATARPAGGGYGQARQPVAAGGDDDDIPF